jgi:hypothetical protein
MAHHQGMSIVALANVLLARAPRRWGMGDARIEAVASLLHERTPREVPRLHETPASSPPETLRKRGPGVLRDVLPGMAAIEPTHLLSNGRYAVTLRANGAGTSRWGKDMVSRSRDDVLRDSFGTFLHLRWDRQPRAVSLTQHPAPDRAAHYHASFHGDRAWFGAVWPELDAETTVWVSPEDDIEFRRVVLRNKGERMLDVELLSAFEVSLADARADEAHPAFQNLFVAAEWQPGHRPWCSSAGPASPPTRACWRRTSSPRPSRRSPGSGSRSTGSAGSAATAARAIRSPSSTTRPPCPRDRRAPRSTPASTRSPRSRRGSRSHPAARPWSPSARRRRTTAPRCAR